MPHPTPALLRLCAPAQSDGAHSRVTQVEQQCLLQNDTGGVTSNSTVELTAHCWLRCPDGVPPFLQEPGQQRLVGQLASQHRQPHVPLSPVSSPAPWPASTLQLCSQIALRLGLGAPSTCPAPGASLEKGGGKGLPAWGWRQGTGLTSCETCVLLCAVLLWPLVYQEHSCGGALRQHPGCFLQAAEAQHPVSASEKPGIKP